MPALRTTFLTMATVLADEAEEDEDEEEDDESDDDDEDEEDIAAAAAAEWRCDAAGARRVARYQAAPIAAAPTAATAAIAHVLSVRLNDDDVDLFTFLDDDGAELLPLGAAPALGFDILDRIRNRSGDWSSATDPAGGKRKHSKSIEQNGQ
jgi:hypothetical protein